MITIRVKNFRQWSNSEWEFPDTGLVRLAGISEAGKSSVLFAIAFALYGSNATRNVNTIGCKGAEVSFNGFGLDIVRSKNPEKLVCNGLIDDAAQKLIDEKLGNYSEFSASSFIKQKLKDSLLSLAPAEQLRFVQKLAFGNDDPDVYRDKIFAQTKEFEQRLRQITNDTTSIHNRLETLGQQLSQVKGTLSLEQIRDMLSKKELEEKELKTEIGVLALQKDNIKNNINTLQKKLIQYESNQEAIQKLKNNIKRYELELSELNRQELLPILDSTELSELQRKFDLCASHKLFLLHEQQIQKQIKQCDIDIKSCDTREELLTELDAILHNNTKILQDYVSNRENTANELTEYKNSLNVLECPKCKSLLRYENSELVYNSDTHIPDINKKISIAIKNLKQIDESISKYTKNIEKIKHLISMASINKVPYITKVKSIEELEIIGQKINEKLKINTENIYKNKTLADNIQKAQKYFNEYTNEYNKAIISTDLNINLTNISTEIQGNESCLSSIIEQKINVETKLLEIQESIKTLHKKEVDQTKYTTLKEQETQCLRELDVVLENNKDIKNKYQASIRLKNLSDIAATESVASILDSINFNVKVYLDMLFPDQGTIIKINNEKENKDGKKKAQLSLSILHKGIEYTNIDEFSGGAESRVMLAFQLALSDLYNSPILMLDEPFQGTHPELKEDCIKALKGVGLKKLVLLVEHGVQDNNFDQIMEIT